MNFTTHNTTTNTIHDSYYNTINKMKVVQIQKPKWIFNTISNAISEQLQQHHALHYFWFARDHLAYLQYRETLHIDPLCLEGMLFPLPENSANIHFFIELHSVCHQSFCWQVTCTSQESRFACEGCSIVIFKNDTIS